MISILFMTISIYEEKVESAKKKEKERLMTMVRNE